MIIIVKSCPTKNKNKQADGNGTYGGASLGRRTELEDSSARGNSDSASSNGTGGSQAVSIDRSSNEGCHIVSGDGGTISNSSSGTSGACVILRICSITSRIERRNKVICAVGSHSENAGAAERDGHGVVALGNWVSGTASTSGKD